MRIALSCCRRCHAADSRAVCVVGRASLIGVGSGGRVVADRPEGAGRARGGEAGAGARRRSSTTCDKTAVIGITETYVRQQSDTRRTATRGVPPFRRDEQAGHHYVRLVDVRSASRRATRTWRRRVREAGGTAMKDGKAVPRTGRRRRTASRSSGAATVVPALRKPCASCHGVKRRHRARHDRYEVPIEVITPTSTPTSSAIFSTRSRAVRAAWSGFSWQVYSSIVTQPS